jgi:hypothetical protein
LTAIFFALFRASSREEPFTAQKRENRVAGITNYA